MVTGRINRDPVRSSAQVLNVLSAEDIARTGEGDIAGALSRVSGLSVVGGGRVFVRGLGDRYSLALLNGLPLPSPEPLSRVVPLDIFPTNVVASSLVQKSYSANFPGEFGGGVINLTTRAVPTENFLRISGGIGAGTETTFQNGLSYFGSDFDWFGFDNGNRDIPSNLQAFIDSGVRIDDTPGSVQEGIAAQLFPTNLVTLQRIGNLPANFSTAVSGGTSFEIGDGNYLGIIATASLSNTWRNRSVKSQQANTDLSVVTSDFDSFITDNNVLVNGLLGFGFRVWRERDTLHQPVHSRHAEDGAAGPRHPSQLGETRVRLRGPADCVVRTPTYRFGNSLASSNSMTCPSICAPDMPAPTARHRSIRHSPTPAPTLPTIRWCRGFGWRAVRCLPQSCFRYRGSAASRSTI